MLVLKWHVSDHGVARIAESGERQDEQGNRCEGYYSLEWAEAGRVKIWTARHWYRYPGGDTRITWTSQEYTRLRDVRRRAQDHWEQLRAQRGER